MTKEPKKLTYAESMFIGVIAGLVTMLIACAILRINPGITKQKLIECERELPRNQHCELIAKPKFSATAGER